MVTKKKSLTVKMKSTVASKFETPIPTKMEPLRMALEKQSKETLIETLIHLAESQPATQRELESRFNVEAPLDCQVEETGQTIVARNNSKKDSNKAAKVANRETRVKPGATVASNKKTSAERWYKKLDQSSIEEAYEEAVVDAYDEYEQHSGFLNIIEDQLIFPFQVIAIGKTVTVVDMEWPKDDSLALDLICELNGERFPVEARLVELIEPLPEGHIYLAAYLVWKSRL